MGNDYKLFEAIMESSEADNWEEAVNEWEIVDWQEDESQLSNCICGKERIKYLFTIRNIYNNIILEPIGSSCIKKFNRSDMNEEVGLREQLFNLLHAVEEDRYLSLSTDLFSRKLLEWLYEEGAFNKAYNNYEGEEDYLFMRKMFNKRHKEDITEGQNKKIKAILLNSIKPFIKDILQDHIIC